MSERKDIARRLVGQKAIGDLLRELDAETREQVRELFSPGDAEAITDDAGEQVGRVRMDAGRTTWKVTDPAAFEAWVTEHLPHAIVTTTSVDPTTERALLKAGEWLNERTGELVRPDGIDQVRGAPRLVVTTTELAERMARDLLANGTPALPPF